MSKIQVDYLHDSVSVNCTRTHHFITLYRGYIYEVSTKDLVKLDSELESMETSFVKWAAEEVLRVGLITLYHHWERSICALLKEQGDRSKIAFANRKSRSINDWVRSVLDNSFDARVDDKIWADLEELRRIVNTLKHADLCSYQDLENDFGHYFPGTKSALLTADDFLNCFVIGVDNYDRLSANVLSFWETLPYTVNYTRR